MISALFTKTYGAADLQAAMGNSGEASVSASGIVIYAVLFTAYLLIALFLLRRSKCEEIVRRFEGLHQQAEVCNN